MEILLCEVAGQRCGVPLERVEEVVRAAALAELPHAPAVAMGVLDLRGALVPVLDGRARFGLPPAPLALSDRFVILRAAGRLLGLRVDAAERVAEVEMVPAGEASGVPEGWPRVAGVARLADGLALVHDVDAFLSQGEALALREALARAGAAG